MGLPRSGTTLTERIIVSGKNQIQSLGETDALDKVFFSEQIINNYESDDLQTQFIFDTNSVNVLIDKLLKQYHEHYFYHTASSLQKLAEMAGLELYRVDHVPTKGGSYRLLLGYPSSHKIHSSLKYWIYRESISWISSTDTWKFTGDTFHSTS